MWMWFPQKKTLWEHTERKCLQMIVQVTATYPCECQTNHGVAFFRGTTVTPTLRVFKANPHHVDVVPPEENLVVTY